MKGFGHIEVVLILYLQVIAHNECIFETKCCKDSYHHVITAVCCSMPGLEYGASQDAKLKSFRIWKFAQPQKLFELPIDSITENYVRKVHGAIFSFVATTPYSSKPVLVAVSREVLVDILDINASAIQGDEDFLAMVSGGRAVRGSTPVAHRYGGHQFGSWADQLGDGRAHILGEYINDKNERWELQLKGSGRTPYSRHGDGRAVLRSSVREFLCSEAMYYLGVPTSRAASLVVSDDTVWRDRFYDGHPIRERSAVVLRVAQSWFRIGSLEILKHEGEIKLLKKLVDFILKEYFPQVDASDSNRYIGFFHEVVAGTAEMIAKWQSIGFAHGVCNTDNFSLLSITIDYGPFGFLDAYDPEFVPNTSDDEHRYSFEKQPDVGYFNLKKLRLAILPLLTENQKIQTEKILEAYVDMYKTKFMAIYTRKLGLTSVEDGDEYLVALLLKMMTDMKSDFTMTFRELGEWHKEQIKFAIVDPSLWALTTISTHSYFKQWCKLYSSRIQKSKIPEKTRHENMQNVNPRYILRNWMAEDAITAAERNDFSKIKAIHEILRQPFRKQGVAEMAGYAAPPPTWASSIRVSCSS